VECTPAVVLVSCCTNVQQKQSTSMYTHIECMSAVSPCSGGVSPVRTVSAFYASPTITVYSSLTDSLTLSSSFCLPLSLCSLIGWTSHPLSHWAPLEHQTHTHVDVCVQDRLVCTMVPRHFFPLRSRLIFSLFMRGQIVAQIRMQSVTSPPSEGGESRRAAKSPKHSEI
jgi:hypothetical protein